MTVKDSKRSSICQYFEIEKSLVDGRSVFSQVAFDAVMRAVETVLPIRADQNALLASIALDYAHLGKPTAISPAQDRWQTAALKARILKVYRNDRGAIDDIQER